MRAEAAAGAVPWSARRARLVPRAVAWLLDVAPFWVVWLGVEHQLGTLGRLLGLPGLLQRIRVDPEAAQRDLVATMITLSVALVFSLGLTGLWVLTRTVCLSRFGTTWGKRALRLRVVSVGPPAPGTATGWLGAGSVRAPGEHPSVRQALLRVGWPQLAGAIPIPGTGMVPYLLSVTDPQGRGTHEHHSHTRTVRR